jgi:hypothetical protein
VDLSKDSATGVGSVVNIQELRAGSGSDVFTGNGGGGTTFFAGPGKDTFTGLGSGNTLVGAKTTNVWSITGLNTGKLNASSYTDIENLVGGADLDTFAFSVAGQETSVVGGGAPHGQGDWLDYSSFSAAHPVKVNLSTGSASNVNGGGGSVSGIENVIGGAGADVLRGDNNGNILIEHGGNGTIIGGTGRSLFITGTGAVTVNGDSGGDLFVGGTTSYDTTATGHLDLMYILAEWRSADPYTTRTNEIRGGTIPLHSGIKLATGVGGTVTLNASAVAEHLNGHPSLTDLDWFFASAASQHSAPETVNGVKELVN